MSRPADSRGGRSLAVRRGDSPANVRHGVAWRCAGRFGVELLVVVLPAIANQSGRERLSRRPGLSARSRHHTVVCPYRRGGDIAPPADQCRRPTRSRPVPRRCSGRGRARRAMVFDPHAGWTPGRRASRIASSVAAAPSARKSSSMWPVVVGGDLHRGVARAARAPTRASGRSTAMPPRRCDAARATGGRRARRRSAPAHASRGPSCGAAVGAPCAWRSGRAAPAAHEQPAAIVLSLLTPDGEHVLQDRDELCADVHRAALPAVRLLRLDAGARVARELPVDGECAGDRIEVVDRGRRSPRRCGRPCRRACGQAAGMPRSRHRNSRGISRS